MTHLIITVREHYEDYQTYHTARTSSTLLLFSCLLITYFLQDYGVVDYIRLRVMPVLGTSPSIFGQAMAAYVLCFLSGACVLPAEFYMTSANPSFPVFSPLFLRRNILLFTDLLDLNPGVRCVQSLH